MATIDSFRRGIRPRISPEDLNNLMWCCTPYPFTSDIRKIRRSLRRYLRLGGGSIEGAIDAAHRELDAAFALYKQRFPDG